MCSGSIVERILHTFEHHVQSTTSMCMSCMRLFLARVLWAIDRVLSWKMFLMRNSHSKLAHEQFYKIKNLMRIWGQFEQNSSWHSREIWLISWESHVVVLRGCIPTSLIKTREYPWLWFLSLSDKASNSLLSCIECDICCHVWVLVSKLSGQCWLFYCSCVAVLTVDNGWNKKWNVSPSQAVCCVSERQMVWETASFVLTGLLSDARCRRKLGWTVYIINLLIYSIFVALLTSYVYDYPPYPQTVCNPVFVTSHQIFVFGCIRLRFVRIYCSLSRTTETVTVIR